MQVLVIPNHKAPIVKHMVWYKAGSADEPHGRGGTAHLLEHLMFRGTKKSKTESLTILSTVTAGKAMLLPAWIIRLIISFGISAG